MLEGRGVSNRSFPFMQIVVVLVRSRETNTSFFSVCLFPRPPRMNPTSKTATATTKPLTQCTIEENYILYFRMFFFFDWHYVCQAYDPCLSEIVWDFLNISIEENIEVKFPCLIGLQFMVQTIMHQRKLYSDKLGQSKTQETFPQNSSSFLCK